MRYFFLFLLPLARLAGAQAPAPLHPPHTILVRGTAEQELDPEKLDLLLTYRFSDNVKESGRTQEQEQALQQVLKQAGIAPEKLVLEDLSASGYGGFSKTANTSVALTKVYRLSLDNPKILNDLIPRLVQTGADNLRVTNLENARLEAIKVDVAGRAAANARQKAQSAVKLAGGQLAGVVAMVEILPGGLGNDPLGDYRLGYDKRMKLGSNSEMQAETGSIFTPNLRKIKVQAVYDVVFEIK
ncbi:SIMPL domain-containing protein [Hymenobacter sp. DH14]|uniref:SIMPL domain-containing protein n=1 Tax=Hymenobacter cyanobacteriorum TaxID=2926463 RepID=A0A9X2AFL0_9BACT|nr:SIMPL domain-containing protein [Hymenobacter cyanobacteriorum]MCI1186623.1 SIMPL domain-containing protein [Hymenobacter cyanobacteriorum]